MDAAEPFGFDDDAFADDAAEHNRQQETKQREKERRIARGEDPQIVGDAKDRADAGNDASIAQLTPRSREARWGFTHEELRAATKVITTLYSNPHLFVGDPVLADTRLYTMVSRDRATKRGNPAVVKKMLAQEMTRKKKEMRAQDLAALQKTTMKQERDNALKQLLLPPPPPPARGEDDGDDEEGDDIDDDDDDNNHNGSGGALRVVPKAHLMTIGVDTNNNGAAPAAASSASAEATAGAAPSTRLNKAMACHICHTRFRELHHYYYSLCSGCAELNYR